MKPRPTRVLLKCPAPALHDLGSVVAAPGTAFAGMDPFHMDNGSCYVVPEPDTHLLREVAKRRTIDPAAHVALSELAAILRVPRTTVHALIGAGMPVDLDTQSVRLNALADWTHTARGGPGDDQQPGRPYITGHWAWTCWPCLREGIAYPQATGAIPVRTLVRLVSAAHLRDPGSTSHIPAVARDLKAAMSAVAADLAPDELDRAAKYFTIRLTLSAEPAPSRIITKLHRPGVSQQ